MATAMFTVKLAPPGKTGMRPNKLLKAIKKKIVNKNGKYFLYDCSPMADFAISSLTKIISWSKMPWIPLGGELGFLKYVLATEINKKHKVIEFMLEEIYKCDKAIDIIFKYVDKKHHKEIMKELDEMGWYNKEGNDSIR